MIVASSDAFLRVVSSVRGLKTNRAVSTMFVGQDNKVLSKAAFVSGKCLKSHIGLLFASCTTKSKVFAAVAIIGVFLIWLRNALWNPSRKYNREANSVGKEYDAWTSEGILEYYWGEHIHLGYYNEKEREKGYLKKNFIQAKYDFIDEMMAFGGISTSLKPLKVLDVGCGIGGTTRYLADKYGPGTEVTGITLSPNQVARAQELAAAKGLSNTNFQVMDALDMSFPDNSFDVVWACESGEHMPDKKKYVEEMARVLKPGGKLVVATWCQRDDTKVPFMPQERKTLDFLYAEWTHPFFISIEKYVSIMDGTSLLRQIRTEDWAEQTLPSWRHSIWVGVFDPWPVISRPRLWWKVLRDAVTLERMHEAFSSGLMKYGMFAAVKLNRYTPPL